MHCGEMSSASVFMVVLVDEHENKAAEGFGFILDLEKSSELQDHKILGCPYYRRT